MSSLFDGSVGGGTLAFLFLALGIALGFEFVNGFHDTANAVATVIYTRSLSPRKAVIWSGLCNFAGVALGGTAVAFGIVNLLPVDLLVKIGSYAGMEMVLALLIAATIWNLGTWWLGLPASSSHTLIGAIVGVGLVHSWRTGVPISEGVNWKAVGAVGMSLLISPIVGFVAAAILLRVLKRFVTDPKLYEPAAADQPPPKWIRGTLIATCTGVSLAHGSNDGQKGIGIVMLILIGIVPAHYLIDPDASGESFRKVAAAAGELDAMVKAHEGDGHSPDVRSELQNIQVLLEGRERPGQIPESDRRRVRSAVLRSAEGLRDWEEDRAASLSDPDRERVKALRTRLLGVVEYAPKWVMVAVATALGLGTTVGWKRIVQTVGEKIGKSHLSYAQGAAAEIVAMTTIGLADFGGLPVSTTHVLSSGVAGTMAANGSGLQWNTVRNIALAWVLTLPAAMTLSGGLFLLFRTILG